MVPPCAVSQLCVNTAFVYVAGVITIPPSAIMPPVKTMSPALSTAASPASPASPASAGAPASPELTHSLSERPPTVDVVHVIPPADVTFPLSLKRALTFVVNDTSVCDCVLATKPTLAGGRGASDPLS